MNRFLYFTLYLAVLLIAPAYGQEEQPKSPIYSTLSSDSLSAEVGLIPESLDADVDSLLKSWHVQYFSKRDAYCHDDDNNVLFPDSIYKQRLERMPRVIPMRYNEVVRKCIDLYAGRRRGLVRYMLGMADFYFPIIEQVLDKYNMPIELKYLAIVESALNPTALSRVGAAGLWQFMLPTGKIYGLEINSLVDERRDPQKATEAACRYMKDMYDIYGDWNLVMASFNCGPGNVNKAIRRSGGKKDFWEIFPYLPRETRSYVPLFIAANYIMNYYCDHNICPIQTNLPLATDTIMVSRMLHLQQVADVLQLDIEQIRALNPEYKRDIIPGNAEAMKLKLPASQSYTFIDREEQIYAYKTSELLGRYMPQFASIQSGNSNKEKIVHIVKSGENLYTIANIYGVTAKEIRKWNGLRSNRVSRGKQLKLIVNNGGVAYASAKAKNEKAQNKVKGKAVVATTQKDKDELAKLEKQDVIMYKVRSGDSLYSIAKKYPGVSSQDLQKINGLANTSIRPGQIIKIPKG